MSLRWSVPVVWWLLRYRGAPMCSVNRRFYYSIMYSADTSHFWLQLLWSDRNCIHTVIIQQEKSSTFTTVLTCLSWRISVNDKSFLPAYWTNNLALDFLFLQFLPSLVIVFLLSISNTPLQRIREKTVVRWLCCRMFSEHFGCSRCRPIMRKL